MTGTLTADQADRVRETLRSLIAGVLRRGLLIEIGYTFDEVEALVDRLGRIAGVAVTVAGDDPRLVRLHALWEAHPSLVGIVGESVGLLLGTGGWLVTPYDLLAVSARAAFARFLDNVLAVCERLAGGDPGQDAPGAGRYPKDTPEGPS